MNNKIYGLLGLARKAGKISFGTQSCIEAIEKRKAKLVIIAEDCSDRTKKNFEDISKIANVPIMVMGTIENISKCIGQNNKAVIVVRDENFAKEIIQKIDGGEIIG